MYMRLVNMTAYRVLKWWRHKNEISEITGFVRIFWKNNVQEAYLPKMSISGQIDPPKKLEGFVWSFLSIIGLRL